MKSIKAGIIGGGGYTAGELIRILLNHPFVEIDFAESASQSGKRIDEVHKDLVGETDLLFFRNWHQDVDILFLCKGHGHSRSFLSQNKLSPKIKVIDLSQDFRLYNDRLLDEREFIYGLPELNRKQIKKSSSVANPGCFATSIELALLPLAPFIEQDVHIHSITGSTGAGQNPSATSHFSWRDNNISTYKVFNHQHLSEINEVLLKAAPEFNSKIRLVPIRGNFSRGIFTSLYTRSGLSVDELIRLYRNYFNNHPFVHITEGEISLKQVINTNKCILSVWKEGDFVFVTSILDNLMKGASGQAVQNMNLMLDIPETSGLNTKPSGF